MDAYKRILKWERRRGYPCLVLYAMIDGQYHGVYTFHDTPFYADGGGLCGCGSRTPPTVKERRRLVRRQLKRDLEGRVVETCV